MGLVEVDHSGSVGGSRDASLLSEDRLGKAAITQPPEDPGTRSDQDDERDGEAADGSSCSGKQMRSVRVQLGVQLNAAALPTTQLDSPGH